MVQVPRCLNRQRSDVAAAALQLAGCQKEGPTTKDWRRSTDAGRQGRAWYGPKENKPSLRLRCSEVWKEVVTCGACEAAAAAAPAGASPRRQLLQPGALPAERALLLGTS